MLKSHYLIDNGILDYVYLMMFSFPRKVAIGILYFMDKEGSRFLVANNFRNRKVFVGGGMKKNESLENALFREIKEETGTNRNQIERVTPIVQKFYYCYHILFLKISTEQNFFLVKLKEKPILKKNWETKEFYWLDPKDVLSHLSYENFKEAYSQAILYI